VEAKGWRIIISSIILLFLTSHALAQGLKGWINLNYNWSWQNEDGKKVGSFESLYQNYYLSLEKPITPLISSSLYLRTSFRDGSTTDAEGKKTDIYNRSIEPALDLYLRNPIYNLSGGYRRAEDWTSAHLTNKHRKTTEYLYSRFDMAPEALPSLSFQFDQNKYYDHIFPKERDTTDTRYFVASTFSQRPIDLSYNFTYSHNVSEAPQKSIEDGYNHIYRINFSQSLFDKLPIFAGYQGNYIRNKSIYLTPGTYSRFANSGLYMWDETPSQTVPPEEWESIANLIDGDKEEVVEDIKIGSTGSKTYHNIGIEIRDSQQSVNKLKIYIRIDKGLSPDSITWDVYQSNDKSNWNTIITNKGVSPKLDTTEDTYDIYYYEISFDVPSPPIKYYKAVNKSKASVMHDVYVTEIEVWGEEEAGSEWYSFFTQSLNFNASFSPLRRLNFSFNYFIDKADQQPESFGGSFAGLFENMFSKSGIGEETEMESTITRTFGSTCMWETHRLLTTTLRYQRNDSYDNKGEMDFSSNTYSLAFNSSPLETLDTTLSLIRTDQYSFGQRQMWSNSYMLSVISQLYKDVNMITDMGYTHSRSYITYIKSISKYISGTLDVLLTKKLFSTLTYNFNWSTSNGASSESRGGTFIVTYRPSRVINTTLNFTGLYTDGEASLSEGIMLDWLPLPAIRLNFNYQHSSEPGVKTDSLNSQLMWYITKFMDLQFSSSISRSVQEVETYSYNFMWLINCRF